MKLWLALPGIHPGPKLRDYAIAAQEAGAEGVTIAEHLVVPSTAGIYPYTGQRAEIPLGTPFPDPLLLIVDLAARASQLKFMTNMLLAPLVHPITLARQVGTAVAMTDGRLDLGLGAGWMREEFDAIDVPFEERGARLNEILEVVPKLLAGGLVEHTGKCFDFGPIEVPTPPCAVPLYVGGTTHVALRRAARFADGWAGLGVREDELATILARIRQLCDKHRKAGRARLQIRTTLKGRIEPDRFAAHAALGVDALVVQAWQVTGSKPCELQTATRVGERFAELTEMCAELEVADAGTARLCST